MIKHFILPALTCVVFLFTCNQPLDNDSIFDPEYDGNYDLSVISPPFDTLLTETPYIFTFTTGLDAFESVKLVHPDTNTVKISSSDSSIKAVFKAPYSGNLIFEGLRPNRKTVRDSFAVVVIYDTDAKEAPQVYFSEKTYDVSRGDSTTFIAADSNGTAVNYIWQFGSQEPETTTVGSITKLFSSSDTLTATLYATDRFGRNSDTDSVEVIVQPFEYKVTLKAEDTIRAGFETVFSCGVNDSSKLNKSGGKYYWSIAAGADTFDTSGTGLDKIKWTAHDSSFFYVSVFVEDTLGRKSSKVQKPVTIRLFRPVLTFDNDDTLFARTGVETTLSVTVYDTDPLGGKIDSLFFDLDSDGVYEKRTKESSFTVTFFSGGIKHVTAYATDKDGFRSLTDTLVVKVSSDRPYFTQGTKNTTVFVNSSLLLQVNAHPGESDVAIDSYLWTIKGAQTLSKTTKTDTLRVQFTKPGVDTITVSCKDKDGIESISEDTIIVTTDPGKPQVRGFSPNTVWIFDTTTYTVSAFDTNGTVEKYLISWEEDSAAITYSDSVVEHSYSSAGLKTVTVTVKDNDGYVSQEYTDTVIVKEGRPEANITVAESAWSYETVVCTVSGTDPNGTITKWAVSWDNGETFEISDKDSVFEKEFSDTGTVTVKCYVVDNDSLKSEIVSSELRIKYSHPSVKSIKSDIDLSSVYVNDMIRFTVKGTDPNGSIDSIKVSWDGKSSSLDMKKKAEKDSAVFTHAFSVSDTGKNKILFRVIDNDGLYRDSSITVEVKSGTPSVLSLYCERDMIWVNDTNKYRVKAQDPNGYIRKLYVNWEGGDEFEDSLLISGSRSSIDTFFTHFYDTTGGEKTVRVWAKDEDSLLSAVKDTVFTVRKGAPEVWGDSDDTLWVVVDDGVNKNYPLNLVDNAYDSNGINNRPVRYYINDGEIFDSTHISAKKSSDGNFEWYVDEDRVNTNPKRIQFYVLDDDGFLRGGEFVVFADSAPGEIVATHDAATYGRTISWSGMDKKDSLDTEYRILVKLGSSLEESDTTEEFIAKDWTRGNDPEFGYEPSAPKPFSWTYIPDQGNDTYFYQVIARDARGSVSKSSNQLNFDWTDSPE